MPFRAVVVDLDGTLLNEYHRISDYTLTTLLLLLEKGVAVIFATGRPHTDVFHTIDISGLHGNYLITSNGTRVFDPQRRMIAEHNLDPKLVEDILKVLQTNEGLKSAVLSTNIFRDGEWLTDHGNEEMLKIFSRSGLRYKVVDFSAISYDGVNAMFFVGDRTSLVAVETVLNHSFSERVEHSFSTPYVLDVVPHGVHKGNAMREVAGLLGITLEDIIAFGDGMNDFYMLKMAGKGCVMGNAQECLKAALPDLEVIGLNTEDAVAKKLREVFNLQI